MQVQSHWVSDSVAQGEPFHRLAQHGCALPSGQTFSRTDPSDAWRRFRNALPYGEVVESTMSELKLVGRRRGPALEPLTFVTRWVWLLGAADLHGDGRGSAKALRWWCP